MAATKRNSSNKQGISPGDRMWMRSGGVLLFIAVIAVAAYWMHQKIQDPSLMPVKSVILEGDFEHVERSELQKIVSTAMKGGFFMLDVSEIQTALKQLQWVSGVTVRRVWPDALVIRTEEHAPLARWGAHRLISDQGELFKPHTITPFKALPRIDADARFAADVMQQFHLIRESLQGRASVLRLRRNARNGWTVWLASEVRIELGNSKVMERLARARLLLDHFDGETAMLDVVDARYSGGVAVSMKQQDTPKEELKESQA
ncbi:MAG: FtsQ-type POTRA domain-containing protein [Pseudomonadota bacterium]